MWWRWVFSAVLAHILLNERLHSLGILGCLLCIVGSVVIVLHAPEEQPIDSLQHLWNMAMRPGEYQTNCIIPGGLMSPGDTIYR